MSEVREATSRKAAGRCTENERSEFPAHLINIRNHNCANSRKPNFNLLCYKKQK